MAAPRQKRLPISCEPCRIRKIRCNRPRGPPPCETCVRRGLASDCEYIGRDRLNTRGVQGHPPTQNSRQYAHTTLPPSPLSERSASATSQNSDSLAQRVAKLEQMLQGRSATGYTPSTLTPSQRHSSSSRPKGTLSVSDSGYIRFIPSAFSWNSSDNLLIDSYQATASSIALTSGPFPFEKRNVDLGDLLDDLPARSHCIQLKNVFRDSFASLFHILHDPTFEKQYEEFENNPESTPLSWIALLYAVLGTAITALESSSNLLDDLSRKPDLADKIVELSGRYRNAAMKCLEADNYLWQHNIATLQALIILVYSINHSHGQAWSLLGLTHHIALSLGCHVDPSEFGLDAVSCEERRRCWAGVMMLYMLQNTSLGHIGPDHHHSNVDVRLPADLNDSDIRAGEQSLPLPSGRPTQMSYLLFKFRLYDISSEMSALVLNTSDPASTLIAQMDQRILDEQQVWGDKYVAHYSGRLPPHHNAHLNILHGYAHQMTLLLHHQAMRYTPTDTESYNRSALRCKDSAREIIKIHKDFFCDVELSPFGWYLRGIGSFHAFHAAVSLIAIVASSSWNDDDSIIFIIRDCTERFETLSSASQICRKAAPVLRHLYNTIDTWPLGLHSHATPTTLPDEQVTTSSLGNSLHADDQSGWSGTADQDMSDRQASNMLNTFLDQLDPHLWLAPSTVAWDQWNSLLSHVPVAGCV